jgi:hypothetical protein
MKWIGWAFALLMVGAIFPGSAGAQNAPTVRSLLEVIRSRIAQQGQIVYSATVHDSATNQTWGNNFTVQATDVGLDEEGCRVDYHWHTTVNGKVSADIDASLQFRRATDIALVSMSEDMVQAVIKAGHETWGISVSPQIWVIHLHRGSDGLLSSIDFRDKATAQTVLDTIKQVVRLCG